MIFFSGSFRIKYFPYLVYNFFLKLTASVFSKKYSAGQLVKAYLWLISNRGWIKEQRKQLGELKLVSDNEVLKFISGKIFNGENLFEKIMNSLSVAYCRLTGLRILENQRKSF